MDGVKGGLDIGDYGRVRVTGSLGRWVDEKGP